MKTVGITAEYDPFHNGHLYQLRRAKELAGADCAIVILGGDFLQRGMPGLYGKWIRTEMALAGGADLVIQLPHFYSCNSGQEYAGGAVSILDGLGCVDVLSFGCEEEDLRKLDLAASVMPEEKQNGEQIRSYLKQGYSYPDAVTRTVSELVGREAAELLRKPNNLLAVEYLRVLKRLHSGIYPLPVRRTETIARNGMRSAGEIREAVRSGRLPSVQEAVPPFTFRIMGVRRKTADPEQNMLRYLLYRIRTADRRGLSEMYSVSEGLEARLQEAAAGCPKTLDELLDVVQTRRYTRARIRRTMVHILMGFTQEMAEAVQGAVYARILGFSETGRDLLRQAADTASIPILSNLRRLDQYDERIRRSVELDLRAEDLRTLLCGRLEPAGAGKNRIPLMPDRAAETELRE